MGSSSQGAPVESKMEGSYHPDPNLEDLINAPLEDLTDPAQVSHGNERMQEAGDGTPALAVDIGGPKAAPGDFEAFYSPREQAHDNPIPPESLLQVVNSPKTFIANELYKDTSNLNDFMASLQQSFLEI